MSKKKEQSKVLNVEVKDFIPTLKNVRKLLSKIESDDSDKASYLRDVLKGETWKYDVANIINHDKVFIFENEEVYGGDRGDGEKHWIVFSITEETEKKTYWQIPGYYASYDDAYLNYDEVFQVEPYEKTVRDWRAVKN